MDEGRIRQETLRYLGYGRKQPDGQVEALLNDCREELEQALACRYVKRECSRICRGERHPDGTFFCGEQKLKKKPEGLPVGAGVCRHYRAGGGSADQTVEKSR